MDLKEMITNYTTYIVDDRENNWEVIELSDLQELLDTDRAEQLILNGVSSSFKVDKLHVGINSISLKDSDGNEYVLDEGKVYRKVVIEKYVLVNEKL